MFFINVFYFKNFDYFSVRASNTNKIYKFLPQNSSENLCDFCSFLNDISEHKPLTFKEQRILHRYKKTLEYDNCFQKLTSTYSELQRGRNYEKNFHVCPISSLPGFHENENFSNFNHEVILNFTDDTSEKKKFINNFEHSSKFYSRNYCYPESPENSYLSINPFHDTHIISNCSFHQSESKLKFNSFRDFPKHFNETTMENYPSNRSCPNKTATCKIRNTFKSSKSFSKNQKFHHFHFKNDRYTCQTCLRKFKNSSSLCKHKRVHTGDKPFKCLFCHVSFSQSSNLNRHCKTIHKMMKFDGVWKSVM